MVVTGHITPLQLPHIVFYHGFSCHLYFNGDELILYPQEEGEKEAIVGSQKPQEWNKARHDRFCADLHILDVQFSILTS